jgi:hypothetical protein
MFELSGPTYFAIIFETKFWPNIKKILGISL